MLNLVMSVVIVLVAWGLAEIVAKTISVWLAKQDHRKLEKEGRQISLEQIRKSGEQGFILVNLSRRRWHGLRYWWICQKPNDDPDPDIVDLWFSRGMVIANQKEVRRFIDS